MRPALWIDQNLINQPSRLAKPGRLPPKPGLGPPDLKPGLLPKGLSPNDFSPPKDLPCAGLPPKEGLSPPKAGRSPNEGRSPPKAGMYLVQMNRQLTVTLHVATNHVGNDFLVRWANDEIPLVAILEAQ